MLRRPSRAILSRGSLALAIRRCSTKRGEGGVTATADDSAKPSAGGFSEDAAPPMPPNYVPIADRATTDESLLFIRRPNSAKIKTKPIIPEGCIEAPFLEERPPKVVHYVDEHARRLKSTSVGGGRPLIDTDKTSMETLAVERCVGGDVRKPTTESKLTSRTKGESAKMPKEDEDPSLRVVKRSGRRLQNQSMDAAAGAADHQATSANEIRTFSDAPETANASSKVHHETTEATKEPEKPMIEQLREDMEKLERSEGTPEYKVLLADFRKKYSSADLSLAADKAARPYSDQEIASGLQGEPLDFFRSSKKLQAKLTSGPHAYHPFMVLEQQGFQLQQHHGYAFSPTLELGKLSGGSLDLQSSKPDFSLAPKHHKDQVEGKDAHKDTSLAFQYLGINTIQRQQIRLCMSDLDIKDFTATTHVLMTYPYSDWLCSFYLVLCAWVMYEVQRRYKFYDFYDEYLGLDLRQVRRLEKPLLCMVSLLMIGFVLLHPIILASIATTRIYRILMRRPIGPP